MKSFTVPNKEKRQKLQSVTVCYQLHSSWRKSCFLWSFSVNLCQSWQMISSRDREGLLRPSAALSSSGTTSLWWSCWRPAPRARTSTPRSNARRCCRWRTWSKWWLMRTASLRWRPNAPQVLAAPALTLVSAGKDGLRQLCEPLLCGHGGGDEGDLHVQPHLEPVWGLHCGHGSGKRTSTLVVTGCRPCSAAEPPSVCERDCKTLWALRRVEKCCLNYLTLYTNGPKKYHNPDV